VYGVYGVYNFMTSKELIKTLSRDGWVLNRVKGSHHVFTHPVKKGHLSIPHPKKDLGIGLLQKLLKQAEL
jgi:predicted RNA binding protein YcfA (HicA-like mRNA interferase family)